MPVEDPPIRAGSQFESIVADVFRKAGWRVHRHPAAGDMRADLVVHGGGRMYVVEVKGSSEGRRDRLIPLLSQGILQARAYAQHLPQPAVPMAVVAANHIPASVADKIKQFAQLYAPEVGVGIIDADGLRVFAGPGLEGLDSKPSRHVAHEASPKNLPDLFSDLNQWMLKILLGQRLPEEFISVPREPIRNASQLAKAANVSVMSASRLVNQLEKEGFLDNRGDRLEVVRADELLERWKSANRPSARDIPARWILGGEGQFYEALAGYFAQDGYNGSKSSIRSGRIGKVLARCCIGLFRAAHSLGFGFVLNAPPYIYLEWLDPDVLQRLGLSLQDADRRADVYIRVPSNKESVFRAAVVHDAFLVSDAIQIWLDVSAHPARGREQADEIRRRVLKPLFEKRR